MRPRSQGKTAAVDASRLAALDDHPCLRELTELARRRGDRLWLTGGALRDLVMGRGDRLRSWDLLVEPSALALADAAASAFGLHRKLLNRPWALVELLWPDEAPLRLGEARAPSIEEDLLARDFTANAMAVELSLPRREGDLPRLIDPREGLADLAAGRLVAASWDAFERRPLRALRALLLSHRLGLDLPTMALARARHASRDLARIPAEDFWPEVWPLLREEGFEQWDRVEELAPFRGFLARLEGARPGPSLELALAARRLDRLLPWMRGLAVDVDLPMDDGEGSWACELRAWVFLAGHPLLRGPLLGEGGESEGRDPSTVARQLGFSAPAAARLRKVVAKVRKLAELNWPDRPCSLAELKRALEPMAAPPAGASPVLRRRWQDALRSVLAAASLRWIRCGGSRADKGVDDSLLRLAATLGLGGSVKGTAS